MVEPLSADEKRQATDSIRGYVYQVYQSIYAWMKLGPNDTLILEGAEDFDVSNQAGVATATQVKDRARSVTLRSNDVAAALSGPSAATGR